MRKSVTWLRSHLRNSSWRLLRCALVSVPNRALSIVICGGLILACTNHADAKGNERQSSAQQSTADSFDQIATTYDQEVERAQRPSKDAEPCKRGDDRRYSDLCAQWKAADAAADSAWWAWVAGISSIISTAAVLVAIGLAYQANSIARQTAKSELRAYLATSSVTVEQVDTDARKYVMNLNVINHGQTPATVTNVLFNAIWHFGNGGTTIIKANRDVRLKCHKEPPMNFQFEFDGAFQDSEKHGLFMVSVWLIYTDVFGQKEAEQFGWMMNPGDKAAFHFLNFPVAMGAFSPEVIEEMITERQKARGEDTD